jgi:hypothetical protein
VIKNSFGVKNKKLWTSYFSSYSNKINNKVWINPYKHYFASFKKFSIFFF